MKNEADYLQLYTYINRQDERIKNNSEQTNELTCVRQGKGFVCVCIITIIYINI